MRRAWPGRVVALGLVFGTACGGGGPPAVSAAPSSANNGTKLRSATDGGTKAKDAGKAARGDAGAASAANAPVVKILMPTATKDPNADTILTTSMVTVLCQVTRSDKPGAHDVNQSKIRIKASYGDPQQGVVGVVSAQGTDMFSAELNLAAVPNGAIQFTCEADDTGDPTATGSDMVDTFLDLGPSIQIIEPPDTSIHALITPVLIKFQIDAAPVDPSDTEAAPVGAHLDISGQSFDFTEDPGQKGLYTTSINFNDKTIFPMAPSAAEITVSAASSRTPDAPTRSVKSDITLDADGPSITVSSPKNFTIVGGEVTLVVSISDPSGIKPGSVSGTINQTLFTLDSWNVKGNTYTTQFDTRSFGTQLTELTINIKATDTVGNETTVSHVLRLDNLPPLISLDPPFIREWRQGSTMDKFVCSEPFDPVGGDAMSDGSTSQASSVYRAIVWDETNHSPGATYDYLAGVNPATVTLYFQPATTPLLIDTNGDGICDEINLTPPSPAKPPVLVALSALTHRGTAYYPPSSTSNWNDKNNVAESFCTEAGTDTHTPGPLCPNVPLMPRVISAPDDGAPPGVYAINPTNGGMGECEGVSQAFGEIFPDGWACLAVRAEDNIANVGISPPIRVCFDDGVGTPACDPLRDTLPTCADNCTWPKDLARNLTLKAQ